MKMPTASKKTTKRKTSQSTRANKPERLVVSFKNRIDDFLSRRPHRSFRMTPRAEYKRELELPGYIAFTIEVTKLLWRHKNTFLLLALVYGVMYGAFVGIQSQEQYSTVIDALDEIGDGLFSGVWGAVERAGILFLSSVTLGLGEELGEVQQFIAVISFLMVWLTTVWLLRNLLAGHKVKLRDGLYNAGSPLFATVLVVLLLAIQLLPIGLAVVLYSAALTGGLLDGGVSAMLFWVVAVLLGVLSLYWITSTLIALVIVTIPGMYPYQAIKSAGDLLVGRRIKILMRWLWMLGVVAVAGLVTVIPIILLDLGIKRLIPAIDWLPIVPVCLLILSSITSVWITSYVYLLYRKVVDYVTDN